MAVTIWSTNSSSLNMTTLQLSNEGNLVLQASQNSILWQSFDHPGSTFIQGMHMGINIKTGARQLYTCWRSPDDPAPGNFSMGLDPSGSTQLFIWKDGTVPYWRSGEWNGAANFLGIPWAPLYSKGFFFETEADQKYYTFTACNDSLIRFVLHWNGTDSIFMYAGASQGWEDFWNQPVKQCEVYGACGPNGLCRNNGDLASCSCLDGYQPKSNHAWKAGNRSAGCIRQAALGCLNKGQSGYKKLQVGCMTWSGDLMDLYHFDNGGYDLYVKAPHDSSNRRIAIIAGSVSACIVLLLVVSIFIWRQFVFGSGPKGSLDSTHGLEESTRGFLRGKEYCPKQSQLANEADHIGNNFEVPLFTFDCIATATNNFGSSNKLGEGGFGLVYKGKLPGGEEIAVKRLSATSRQGIEEFKNEVILIAKLQHRNLVRLLGCCIQGREKLLVYEFLPNKSLDAFLFDPSKRGLLDWRKRFNIIEGIARGLLYLHCDSRLRVVHRDLKASNVLGYMSPEYAMEGIFSVKSDVYSFGILLLEIITGERNSNFRYKEDSINIVGYAYKLWHKGDTQNLIDPAVRETCSISEVLRCIHVALLCVQDLAYDRPDILSAIKMIFNEGTDMPRPRQPTFTVQGYSSNNSAMKSSAEYLITDCGVTITGIQGR
ncbi:Serine/threonine-protein kinase [Rhynchospora pubera]|uniref:non-specific serine/threonine protein kinase n=1 Tax=Rhynchospora pubera TaxID=906938 RepID=A0AAV8HRM0_9POAL|nr:Serine/threonine-protein kinase [Rhynchospora pubera]